MNLNVSKASSFDPYDYYKRLTECISKKNNLKCDIRQMPGVKKQYHKKPLITREHLTARFLAKYNNRKEQPQTTLPPSNSKAVENTEKQAQKGFTAKLLPDVGKPKRKKELPCFINLPDSFFHSFNGPDISIFKVPSVPPLKKAKSPELPPSVRSNLSCASVTSTDFKPVETSTPKPMISDPCEIWSLDVSKNNFSLASLMSVPQENSLDTKAKRFLEVVESAAIKLGSKKFEKMSDPLIAIRARIMEVFDAASRSPRVMFETLMEDDEMNCTSPNQEPSEPPPKYVLPKPKFYDEPEKEPGKCHDKSPPKHALSKTDMLFDWTIRKNAAEDNEGTPAARAHIAIDVDMKRSPDFLESPRVRIASFSPLLESPNNETFLFRTPEKTLRFDENSDDELFGFSPSKDGSMSCDFPDLDCLDSQNFDNTFAIFTSPPRSHRQPNRLSPTSICDRRESQRLQKKHLENYENSNKNFSDSQSTYKWNANLFSPVNESFRSPFETPQTQNSLKDSFDLF